MKWKARLREIERLRTKYRGKRWKPALPDLSVERRGPPCSDTVCRFSSAKKELPNGARVFPVGNNHKQGLELITEGMRGYLEFMGGKKPT